MPFKATSFKCIKCQHRRNAIDRESSLTIDEEIAWEASKDVIECIYCDDVMVGKDKYSGGLRSFFHKAFVGAIELGESCVSRTADGVEDVGGAPDTHPAAETSCDKQVKDSPTFSFMDLPPELRNSVYEFTFADGPELKQLEKIPSICQVSKLVRKESLDLYLYNAELSTTIIDGKDFARVSNWLALLSQDRLGAIKTLSIFCDQAELHATPIEGPGGHILEACKVIADWQCFLTELKTRVPDLKAHQLRWPILLPTDMSTETPFFPSGVPLGQQYAWGPCDDAQRLLRRVVYQSAIVQTLVRSAGYLDEGKEKRGAIAEVIKSTLGSDPVTLYVYDRLVRFISRPTKQWLRLASEPDRYQFGGGRLFLQSTRPAAKH